MPNILHSSRLIFSNKRGEYLSNVVVKVIDQKNQTILITVSNGPWLFIDLPTGTYKIDRYLRESLMEGSERICGRIPHSVEFYPIISSPEGRWKGIRKIF